MNDKPAPTVAELLDRHHLAEIMAGVRQLLDLRDGDTVTLDLQPIPAVDGGPAVGFFLTGGAITALAGGAITNLAGGKRDLDSTVVETMLKTRVAPALAQVSHAAVIEHAKPEKAGLVHLTVAGKAPVTGGVFVRFSADEIGAHVRSGYVDDDAYDEDAPDRPEFELFRSWGEKNMIDGATAQGVNDMIDSLMKAGIVTSPIGAEVLLDALYDDDYRNTGVRLMVDLPGVRIADTYSELSGYMSENGDAVDRATAAIVWILSDADALIARFYAAYQPR